MNHALKNIDHPFVDIGHAGVTVRLGTKWLDLFGDGVRTVELWECSLAHEGACRSEGNSEHRCTYHGVGKLLGVWFGALRNLPVELLSIEHEPKSRTRVGLRQSLWRAYGADAGHDQVMATAIIYTRMS